MKCTDDEVDIYEFNSFVNEKAPLDRFIEIIKGLSVSCFEYLDNEPKKRKSNELEEDKENNPDISKKLKQE